MAKVNRQRIKELLDLPRTTGNVNELIILNKGLIYKQLIRFNMSEDPDAISIAYEALYRAIMTFDSDRSSLSTHATIVIYNSLAQLYKDRRFEEPLVYYDAPAKDEDDNPLLDIIVSPNSVEDALIKQDKRSELHSCFKSCFDELTNPMHKCIIEVWVSMNFVSTQRAIAEQVGCTQAYVAQVIRIFRYRLKTKLEAM